MRICIFISGLKGLNMVLIGKASDTLGNFILLLQQILIASKNHQLCMLHTYILYCYLPNGAFQEQLLKLLSNLSTVLKTMIFVVILNTKMSNRRSSLSDMSDISD